MACGAVVTLARCHVFVFRNASHMLLCTDRFFIYAFREGRAASRSLTQPCTISTTHTHRRRTTNNVGTS